MARGTKKKQSFILLHVIFLSAIFFFAYQVINSLVTYGNIDHAVRSVVSLAILVPIELAYILLEINKKAKLVSLENIIKFLYYSRLLILGLVFFLRGLTMYISEGYRFRIGENVAPGALLISGGLLSLMGLYILIKRK